MKSRIIGRKQLLTFGLMLSLSLAVFVNWYYTKPNEKTSEPEMTNQHTLGDAQYVSSDSLQVDDYFENAELNRKKAHDTAKEYLSEIINDSSVDSDTKASAREKLTKIAEQIKIENDIENLITAQTKASCIVTYNSENIEVILPKGTLSDDVVLKIKDVVLTKTKLSTDKITIIETK